MEQTAARPREAVSGRLLGVGAIAGVAGGLGMAMWQMIYSASRGDGFWTPLNVCMASFVYRAEARMMIENSMMHPGISMNERVGEPPVGRRGVASRVLGGGGDRVRARPLGARPRWPRERPGELRGLRRCFDRRWRDLVLRHVVPRAAVGERAVQGARAERPVLRRTPRLWPRVRAARVPAP